MVLSNNKNLLSCERVISLAFCLFSSCFGDYRRYFQFFVLDTLLVIYSLYGYNLLRDYREEDYNELETSNQVTEKMDYHSNDKRNTFMRNNYWIEEAKMKEIETKFEEKLEIEKKMMMDEKNKLIVGFKDEIVALLEQLRVFEEKVDVINEENQERCVVFDGEKRDLIACLNEERKNLSSLENMYGMLEYEMKELREKFEKERQKVLELKAKCMALEAEKRDLARDLAEERVTVSGLEDEVRDLSEEFEEEGEKVAELEDMCATLEEEKRDLEEVLEKEQDRVSELEEKCVALEEEKRGLAEYLKKEREKVLMLEEMRVTLKKRERDAAKDFQDNLSNHKARLDKEFEKLRLQLEEMSVLKSQNSSLRKNVLEHELEVEKRKVLESSKIATAELREVVETLKEDITKKLEEKKKISKLENKCRKLKTERKLWDAQRENLLMVINSQASVVEVYKDMLDKEECLTKLFESSKSKV